jgi:hypothetical protein
MVTWATGNADLEKTYTNSTNPQAAAALGILFVLVMSTVLVSLLTGIMTNSLEKVTSREGERALLSRAQAIDEIEATLPGWAERALLGEGAFPPFLHVLRVDPEEVDAAFGRHGGAWPGKEEGKDEVTEGQGEEGREKTHKGKGSRLEARIEELIQEVRGLRALVLASSEAAAGGGKGGGRPVPA